MCLLGMGIEGVILWVYLECYEFDFSCYDLLVEEVLVLVIVVVEDIVLICEFIGCDWLDVMI